MYFIQRVASDRPKISIDESLHVIEHEYKLCKNIYMWTDNADTIFRSFESYESASLARVLYVSRRRAGRDQSL